MASRSRAAATVALLYCIPFFALISLSMLALITLEKGLKESLRILGLLCIVSVVYHWYAGTGAPVLAISVEIIGLLLPTVIFANYLRQTADISRMLDIMTITAAVLVWLAYVYDPSIATNIDNFAIATYTSNLQDSGIANADQMAANFSYIIRNFVVGIIAAVFLSFNTVVIMLGNYYQRVLASKAKDNSKKIRIDGMLSLVALPVVAIASAFGLFFAKMVLPIFLIPYLLSGIAVVHRLTLGNKYRKFILAMFYLLLAISAVLVSLLLILLTVIEYMFRQYKNNKQKQI